LYAVRVFQDTLSTNIRTLVHAIEWAVRSGAHIVNLSLGTTRQAHEPVLRDAVAHAVTRGVAVVAAREDAGVRWLPGSLPGVVPVLLDWTCPRDEYRVDGINGSTVFRASGFPREIPGVPPTRNLNGVSFAVANMSGFAARARQGSREMFVDDVVRALAGR
jgi:subtilisin family serine protease